MSIYIISNTNATTVLLCLAYLQFGIQLMGLVDLVDTYYIYVM